MRACAASGIAFAAAVAALALLGPPATAARDPWLVAHARLDYVLFRPYLTGGLRLSRFTYIPCGRGRGTDSLYTAYGSVDHRRRTPGLELVQGSPQVCANAGTFTPHGTRTIGGVQARLAVYCGPGKPCPLAQGVRNGYTLYWRQDGTFVQINSLRLTLAQLLAVAASLRRVAS
jgi:hypothetical protein